MSASAYILGIDLGSSSVKASLVEVSTGRSVAQAQSPAEEMPMIAVQPGWAEQDPAMWWEHAVRSVKACLSQAGASPDAVKAVGIAYQMHGLVLIDKYHHVLRPSIIWCDSRAVETGERAFRILGEQHCLSHFLNAPGNFTASKLKWIQDNEPEVYSKIYKVMLPGDYLAMRLTGEVNTTATGLSEGIFWDFKEGRIADSLLRQYQFDAALLAPIVPVFGQQGLISSSAAEVIGLRAGTPVTYRAGDQPNNAFSLNVLQPGETAATAGTSGVIYSVTDQNAFDIKSRVNAFLHVNHTAESVRNGMLLCVNGTGILNSWLRKMMGGISYDQMNQLAGNVPVGAQGIAMLPFGNGAERILENRSLQASFHGIDFNQHHAGHLYRAAQEGIVFALRYGFDILRQMGVKTNVIRAGHANLFLSPVFREAFVNTIGAPLELYNTDGAQGAALGAGWGSGIYHSAAETFRGLELISSEEVSAAKVDSYDAAYDLWKTKLQDTLNT